MDEEIKKMNRDIRRDESYRLYLEWNGSGAKNLRS